MTNGDFSIGACASCNKPANRHASPSAALQGMLPCFQADGDVYPWCGRMSDPAHLRAAHITVTFADDGRVHLDQALLNALFMGERSECLLSGAKAQYHRHRYAIPLSAYVRDIRVSGDVGGSLSACVNILYTDAHDDIASVGLHAHGLGDTRFTASAAVHESSKREVVPTRGGVVVPVPSVGSATDTTLRHLYGLSGSTPARELNVAAHTVVHRAIHGCIGLTPERGLCFNCSTGAEILRSSSAVKVEDGLPCAGIGHTIGNPGEFYTSNAAFYRQGAASLAASVPVIDLTRGLVCTYREAITGLPMREFLHQVFSPAGAATPDSRPRAMKPPWLTMTFVLVVFL